MKIYRTLCSIVKIKTLNTGAKFVKYTCLSYKVENIIEQSAVKACCEECDKEQYAAQPCCSDKCSVERFAVGYRDNYADYALCKFEMMRMPCHEKFQPKVNLDNNISECVQCFSCVCNAISCVCNVITTVLEKLLWIFYFFNNFDAIFFVT